MKSLRQYGPVGVLGLCFLSTLILVMNYQWFAGGYEGLLLQSLKPMISGEALEVNGALTLVPKGNDDFEDIMTMDLMIDGTIDRSKDILSINIALKQPYGDNMDLAQLVQRGKEVYLIPLKEGGEEVNLGDVTSLFFDNKVDKKAQWQKFYDLLQVSKVKAMDPRYDMGLTKRTMVQYEMDMVAFLDSSQKAELMTLIGATEMENLSLLVDFNVDTQGRLANIGVTAESKVANAKGWLTIVN